MTVGDDGIETGGVEDPPAYGDFPLKRFLGMEMAEDEPGVGRATVDIGADHLNPNGVVHGAVLFALVDTAMGKSTMSVIDGDGAYCASIEVSLRFIRPAAGGRLRATATVLKRGRNVVHLDAQIEADDGRLIATAAGTFAILGVSPDRESPPPSEPRAVVPGGEHEVVAERPLE